MTTATLVTGTLTTQTGVRPRRSLEELVDRLMATLTFRHEPATAAANSLEGAMPAVTSRSQTMRTVVRPQRSLEELVDRLMATLTFRHEPDTAAANSLEAAMPVSTSRSRTMRSVARPRRSLGELVDRLMADVDVQSMSRRRRWGVTLRRGGCGGYVERTYPSYAPSTKPGGSDRLRIWTVRLRCSPVRT